ncbi:MAG: non-homologous end-joining DNA ligase [Polyangiaceae bacterium]
MKNPGKARTATRRKPSSSPTRGGGLSRISKAGKGKSADTATPVTLLTEAAQAIPREARDLDVRLGERTVHVTNLGKVFWPELGITKGDLLRYYLEVAPVLLPHIEERAMVMRRYPNGIRGESFFMKRAPSPRPDWIDICHIDHGSKGVIDFPVIDDVASLLWVVNLGCIDLNPWYAPCDDVDRPTYLHFDLDPGSAPFAQVREAALVMRGALESLGMPVLVKTTGSKGMHLYVPIERGPHQHDVWRFAKAFGDEIAVRHPKLMTAEYAVARRPARRVLVDYNQNQWGRTLASIYSVRPHPRAAVSMPVTWDEVAAGVAIEDFRIDNAAERLRAVGDLWAPLLAATGRFPLQRLLPALP